MHTSWDEALIEQLLAHQREHCDQKAFLILDDCLGSVNFRSSIWQKLAANGRHWNITIFITCQYIKSIPPVIRTNVDYAFVFSMPSRTQSEALYDDYGQLLTRDQWISMIDRHTEGYAAVLVDLKTPSKQTHDVYSVVRAPAKAKEFKLEF